MKTLSINTTLNDRICAFAKAGSLLSSFLEGTLESLEDDSSSWQGRIQQGLELAERKNSWFTKETLDFAFLQWSKALTIENLKEWTKTYHLDKITAKNIAIITAGNLPLVGFHDVLCVIISGHHAMIKNSSNDDVLTPLLLEIATSFCAELAESYSYVDGKLKNYDAVIATGSNNTARYFEHYFGDKPNIIRKNRNSVAVLTGSETLEQMESLSNDVFLYFGLGCRSVSHLKVPKGYNFDLFFNGMFAKKDLIKNEKYLNNYDYNKAVYLMSEFDLLDNEFLLIKEEANSYSSPIASLGYSYYDKIEEVAEEFHQNADQLQCVVVEGDAAIKIVEKLEDLTAPQIVDFGTTQTPRLQDYADGVDVIQFLLTLS
ncbi:MAG: acyl-CoA reductase [Nonlabens sp.]|uniref:acyl-CoA reductase n=1 Tax=Nonlabens sp. TaxID=1888209 RepID=UPI00321A581E